MKRYSNTLKLVSLFLLGVFCLTLTACGSASYDSATTEEYYDGGYSSAAAGYYEETAEYEYEYDYDYAEPEEELYTKNESAYGGEEEVYDEQVLSSQVERKLTYIVNVSLETKTYRDALSQIESLVSDFNGYIASSDISDYGEDSSRNYARYASYTVKIPAAMLDGYLEALESAGNILNVSRQVEDITSAYYDTQARLDSLKAEEEKLVEMQENAENLEDMITIESYLTEIRSEMNYLTSLMAVYEEQVSYSTVYIGVSEVVEYSEPVVEDATFLEKIGNAFSESGEFFVEFLQGFVLVLIVILPFLILIGIVVVIIVLLVKSGKKRRLRKRQKAYEEAQARMAAQMNQPAPMPAPENSGENPQ